MSDRPRILKPDIESVILPKEGDEDCAKDVLTEISELMRKRGCCLIASNEPGFFQLCRMDGPVNRCIAKIKLVNDMYFEAGMVKWK